MIYFLHDGLPDWKLDKADKLSEAMITFWFCLFPSNHYIANKIAKSSTVYTDTCKHHCSFLTAIS